MTVTVWYWLIVMLMILVVDKMVGFMSKEMWGICFVWAIINVIADAAEYIVLNLKKG